jgi:hypothetical protein
MANKDKILNLPWQIGRGQVKKLKKMTISNQSLKKLYLFSYTHK